MNNYITELKRNIFSRAKIFIEEIGEFAPFGAKLIDEEIKDIVYYNDEGNGISDSKKALKIFQDNISEEIKNKLIQAGAIAYDVSADFKNSDGEMEKRDALCLKISADGDNWSEEYFPYLLIDGDCIWR